MLGVRALSRYASRLRPLNKRTPRTIQCYSFLTVLNNARFFSSSKSVKNSDESALEPRARDFVDICIVGGGPAGLSTAIKLKDLDNEHGLGDLRVIVLEKAADFGSHIVSGAVLEPRAFNELFPNSEFLKDGKGIALPPDIVTACTKDSMKYLTKNYAFDLPEPPQLRNEGKNYIASLNEVVKFMLEKAEEAGVELYPGISVSELIYDEHSNLIGVATSDMGLDREGKPKDSFERGMEFIARQTVLAEGCHGSLTKKAVKKFELRKDSQTQTYGLGIKEVWEVLPEKFQSGFVGHSMGFPLSEEYGGGFIYHFGDGMVAVGLVIGLDYANPYVSPYLEFQKMKHHPYYANTLEGGKCISYAARALNEGGFQLIPKLYFPGGLLVGCAAGFLNVPKIKGTHNAIKSGIVAAELIWEEIKEVSVVDEETFGDDYIPLSLATYEESFKESWAYKELYAMRNVRPSFNGPLGFLGGLAHLGLTTILTNGAEPWTLSHHTDDASITRPAKEFTPKIYAKPDNKISFDILTSVLRTGTHHDEDEPCHLRIPNQDYDKHAEISWPKYQGIEQNFCPAGVYEYVKDEAKPLGVTFNINSQNCIHCKTCDIKVPTQDIDWQVPEGGDGPKYYMT